MSQPAQKTRWLMLTHPGKYPNNTPAKVVFQVDKIVAFGNRHPEGSWICLSEASDDEPWHVTETVEEILEAFK